ncbi:MAG TPA: response regulator [Treponemataceae bacterium]|nr:response regulator [Treponemataceae bacterium]
MSKEQKAKRIQIYSALEVANMCGVVNQTAINWIRGGHLTAFNTPGGQFRVYKDDLLDFINKRGMRVPEALIDSEPEANWKSLIIIDDDQGLNNAIASYMKKNMSDLVVYQSFDGFDAGAQLVEKKPGFVLLDLALPGINGQDICRKIKNDPAFGKPYVMVITALEEEGLEESLYSLGADKFFKKPLALASLVESINAAVEIG